MVEHNRKPESPFEPSSQNAGMAASPLALIQGGRMASDNGETYVRMLLGAMTELEVMKDREQQREKYEREQRDAARFRMTTMVAVAALGVSVLSVFMLYRATVVAVVQAVVKEPPRALPSGREQEPAGGLLDSAEAPRAQQREARPVSYRVKANDSICRIGGSTEAANAIIELNRLEIVESNGVRWARVFPGRVLLLPPASARAKSIRVYCGNLA
jgi:hypothetical protein